MSRRKEPVIPAELLDRLLAGTDAAAALDQGGLLDSLKKALAERALGAEMDYHLGSDDQAGNSRNGYGRKTVITDTGKIDIDVPRDRSGGPVINFVCGPALSPVYGLPRVGSTLPSFLICTVAVSLAGRSVTECRSIWQSGRSIWRQTFGNPPKAASSILIAAANTVPMNIRRSCRPKACDHR